MSSNNHTASHLSRPSQSIAEKVLSVSDTYQEISAQKPLLSSEEAISALLAVSETRPGALIIRIFPSLEDVISSPHYSFFNELPLPTHVTTETHDTGGVQLRILISHSDEYLDSFRDERESVPLGKRHGDVLGYPDKDIQSYLQRRHSSSSGSHRKYIDSLVSDGVFTPTEVSHLGFTRYRPSKSVERVEKAINRGEEHLKSLRDYANDLAYATLHDFLSHHLETYRQRFSPS